MIYTIQANDEVLGKEKLRNLLNKDSVKSDMMNTVEYDCESAEIDHIIEYCNTSPFFADRKIVVLKKPVFLTSEKTSRDYTEFVDKLMAYMQEPNEQTNLIIFSTYEKLDNKKKIVQYLKEHTNHMLVVKPDAMAINVLVKNMVNRHGGEISDKAVQSLVEKVGDNFQDLSTEIDKLTTFKPNGIIQEGDITDFVTVSKETQIFDLSKAIIEKNTPKAIDLLNELQSKGERPDSIIGILASQLRLALLSKSYAAQGMRQPDIAKALQVHPYRVKLALQLKFSDSNLKDLLVKLSNLDYHIKTNRVNMYQGIKIFILSV